ncbi:MAG: hypothetical protein JWN74_1935 [Acidobacteriaceae bacterium]|nr:hypothetical protein [Acidobacteriaceae bacterium]
MLISRPLYKLCFLAGVASLIGAAGCGGGSGVVIPHPTGNFSNASFQGSYVYQIHGFLADANNSPYRETGVIIADGAGHIVSGEDAFTSSLSAAVTQSTSVTGTYTIASDGTGQILLSSTGLGTAAGAPQISLAITLASTSKAELMEADAFAAGTGTAELQDSTAISAAPSGTFVFRLHQEVETNTLQPASEVGFFTFSGGSLSNGSMDQNIFSVGNTSLTLTNGTLSTPTASGTGTGSFTDSSGFTTDFLYYIIRNGKFVLLVSDSNSVGSGSAEVQTGAVSNGLAGNYAFGSRGDDSNFYAGVATVGEFSGTGATISSGAFDSLQDGTNYLQDVAFTGSPTTTTTNPSPQGRVEVTLDQGAPMIFWMVNPSRAFFLDDSTAKTEDGAADLQTATSFSAASLKGQFAILMDGVEVLPTLVEGLARIGTLQFDGASRLTLVELANVSNPQTGGATSPGALAGTYQVGSGGRVTGSVSNGGGALDVVMYGVSGSQAYVLQVDSGTNTSGMVQLQQ